MFAITDHRGVQLAIGKWTISIQWGPGNYCEHYDALFGEGDPIEAYRAPAEAERWESPTAEIAIWGNREEPWVSFGHDTVKGHVGALAVARLIGFLATEPATREVVEAYVSALFADEEDE